MPLLTIFSLLSPIQDKKNGKLRKKTYVQDSHIHLNIFLIFLHILHIQLLTQPVLDRGLQIFVRSRHGGEEALHLVNGINET